MSRPLTQYLLVTAVAIGLIVGQLLLKVGVRGTSLSITNAAELLAVIRRVLTTPALLAGYIVSGVVALVWLVVISRLELSFAVPLMSAIYYLLLLLTSALFLGEEITVWRWLGTGLILLGMIALTRDPRGG